MKEERKGIQIRFLEDLFKIITNRAKENRRSFNSEVLASLEQYLEWDAARTAILARNRGKADE